MHIRKYLLSGLLASSLALGGSAALAQDSTPMASSDATPVMGERQITLASAEGDMVATALFVESDEGVTITVMNDEDSGLEPGEHGIHIHEFGICTPTEGDEPFSDAGGHFNPAQHMHGAPDVEESHAGDLGNLVVEDDGSIDFEVTTDKVTLMPGADNSLSDEDGSALLIHDGADDLETDPSGDSGSRIACGTIYQHPQAITGTPASTPVVGDADDEDEATPAN